MPSAVSLFLLLIFVLIVTLIIIIINKPIIHYSITGGVDAEKVPPTYMISGFDGSYLWYLKELLEADGAIPVADGPTTIDGFLIRTDKLPPKCTYYHSVLDYAFWFWYNPAKIDCKFNNVLMPPLDKDIGHKKNLILSMAEHPNMLPYTHIRDFEYIDGTYIVTGISSSAMFKTTWSGADIHLAYDIASMREITKNYYQTCADAIAYSQSKAPVIYDMYVVPLVKTKLIDGRSFVITFYVMMIDEKFILYKDYAFICINEDKYDDNIVDSKITICLDYAKVDVFPSQYPYDSKHIIDQVQKIVDDLPKQFAHKSESFRVYNMDIIVDEDDKCWILELNGYYKFYNMLPEGEYAKAMRGLMEWMYKTGIKPRLF